MSNLVLNIVYSDDQIVVVNKPGGLLSVPGRGDNKQDCVTSRLKKIFPDCINQPSVHRLDMHTSGLLLLALNQKAHSNLSVQFQNREVYKEYVAVVDGKIKNNSGKIELAFRLDVDNRPRQIYDPVQGKTGITLWRKIEEYPERTRIKFIPLTGKTHQLRVHAASPLGLNTPIVGDKLYGNENSDEELKLCSVRLKFFHPGTGKEMDFKIEPEF